MRKRIILNIRYYKDIYGNVVYDTDKMYQEFLNKTLDLPKLKGNEKVDLTCDLTNKELTKWLK